MARNINDHVKFTVAETHTYQPGTPPLLMPKQSVNSTKKLNKAKHRSKASQIIPDAVRDMLQPAMSTSPPSP
ncbi:hypothetical protein DOTSEDRAFT_69741 [Dothistroma septosporum NZE10]|uniref:Uncharacterized protein n=1 Tax=Dothistroma septosporum (strain NZE10 / CBS 128990) TaxID=675120 RepID=N1PWW2_DOTSN|nr:hypothetical protein DOTSEDRAFT_69741 [Dothistroma septosporum NZE10]